MGSEEKNQGSDKAVLGVVVVDDHHESTVLTSLKRKPFYIGNLVRGTISGDGKMTASRTPINDADATASMQNFLQTCNIQPHSMPEA